MGRIPNKTLALAVAALLALPSAADAAATATTDGSTITVTGDGANDAFVVTRNGPSIWSFTDNGVSVGCSPCVGNSVTADLGGGNDTWTSDSLPGTIQGNTGDDTIYTGAGNQTLNGGPGVDLLGGGAGADHLIGGSEIDIAMYDDVTGPVTVSLDGNNANDSDGGDQIDTDVEGVLGTAANDTLTGGSGNNFLDGGLGNDTISGGGGNDTVGYWERHDPVTVALGSGVTPGHGGGVGENDTIATDIENAGGGLGDDLIVGNSSANWLSGGWSTFGNADGNDVLRGGGGGDYLDGGGGVNTADYSDRSTNLDITLGGSNNVGDTLVGIQNLIGGSGNDTLSGDANANVLTGGPGTDTLNGWGGDDVFNAREGGVDTISCGDGTDSGTVDTDDVLAADCEAGVERPVVTPPPSDPGGGTDPAPTDPPATDPPATDPPATDPPSGDPSTTTPGTTPPGTTGTGGGDDKTGNAGNDTDPPAPIKISAPEKVAVSSSGDVQIGIKCTAASGTCGGSIDLYEQAGTGKLIAVSGAMDRRVTRKLRRGKLLGKKKFAVKAGKKKTVVVRLSRNGRRRVIKKRKNGKAKPVKAIIAISVTAPDGTVSTTEKGVTLNPPKDRRVTRKHSDKKGKR